METCVRQESLPCPSVLQLKKTQQHRGNESQRQLCRSPAWVREPNLMGVEKPDCQWRMPWAEPNHIRYLLIKGKRQIEKKKAYCSSCKQPLCFITCIQFKVFYGVQHGIPLITFFRRQLCFMLGHLSTWKSNIPLPFLTVFKQPRAHSWLATARWRDSCVADRTGTRTRHVHGCKQERIP